MLSVTVAGGVAVDLWLGHDPFHRWLDLVSDLAAVCDECDDDDIRGDDCDVASLLRARKTEGEHPVELISDAVDTAIEILQSRWSEVERRVHEDLAS